MRTRQRQQGRIERPEDRQWKEWFEGLDTKEHENYLSKLGLDREEIDEWGKNTGHKKGKKGENR